MRTKLLPKPSVRVMQGAVGGLAATAVMTGFFAVAQRRGQIGALPPRIIVNSLLPSLPPALTAPVATVAHFGYGAVSGAAFGLAVKPSRRTIPMGVAHGLSVWAMGYEAWLPALKVFPHAHRDERSRAITILIAHIVYGAALAVLTPRGPAPVNRRR